MNYEITNLKNDIAQKEIFFDLLTGNEILNCKALFAEDNNAKEILIYNPKNKTYESVTNLYSKTLLYTLFDSIKH